MSETVQLPLLHLAAQLAADKPAGGKRASLRWYSGAAVQRYSFLDGRYSLTFSMNPSHVRLGRLTSGNAPVLNSHRDYDVKDVIGVVESASIQNGEGRGEIKFSDRPEVAGIVQDVESGVLKNISMGAIVHALRDTTPKGAKEKAFMAVDWEPVELSIVPVPADAGAHFLAADKTFPCELTQGETMIENTSVTVEKLAAPFVKRGEISAEFAAGLAGKTIEQARGEILDRLAARSEENPIQHTHGAGLTTREEREGLADAMADALVCRYTGKRPGDRARAFMGARIADLAREICNANNLRTTSMDAAESIRLANTTSDFSSLLQGVGRRMLMQAYEAAEPAIKRIARKSTAQDFRAKSVLRLGEAPALEQVPEGAEITHGSRAESAESYRLFTFGKIFGISRQALVNDDLSAFSDWARAWGAAAAQLEGRKLVELLTAQSGTGPNMEDGVALFNSAHNNLITGPGTVINVSNLGEARRILRTQTGLDGVTVLDIAPKYLVVPAALEMVAEQYLADIAAATSATANPFSGKLELVTVPQLDAIDDERWYVFASPEGAAPVLEYSYLAGAEGVQVDMRQGFETLGFEFRAYEDLGVGAIGHRGAVCNDGAAAG